jgi:hypothetical protein
VIDAMRAADPNAQLPRALSQIVTRCLSARKFDMARGSFFDDEMVWQSKLFVAICVFWLR